MCTEAFSLFSFLVTLSVCQSVSLSVTYIYIPTPIEMAAHAWWHNPKKLNLANFISSASCAPGSQPQQKRKRKKKDQWKCCIKPLIRVEHIRIILHAQSGSCYAAAYVVLLAPEFSTLICVHASVCINWKCRVCGVVFDVVCICESKTWSGGKLEVWVFKQMQSVYT